MLSTANDEKAIQVETITEEKQKIIDELQRQVGELSQLPAADGTHKLRTEIDMLKRMISTASDEKAIMLSLANDDKATQIETITEEKQKIIGELQRQVNELSQRPAADGAYELRRRSTR